jgi:hypothetical protein
VTAFNKRTVHLHYHTFGTWSNMFAKNGLEVVFYKYYFPKDVAVLWYKIVKIFTYKIIGRELWSRLAHSKLTPLLPKPVIISFLSHVVLKPAFHKGFLMNSGNGAQLFMVVKKL